MAEDKERQPESLLPYDEWVEAAMRQVVVRALSHVAANGLPGEHHFYVTFRTDYPGVVMPPRLRTQYPQEMTIVLQHQYWGLEVGDDAFEITLSFNRQHERLRVPYDAITSFFDPAVQFGLQFQTADAADEDGGEAGDETAQETVGLLPPGEADRPDEGKNGDNIVTLDRFRKK